MGGCKFKANQPPSFTPQISIGRRCFSSFAHTHTHTIEKRSVARFSQLINNWSSHLRKYLLTSRSRTNYRVVICSHRSCNQLFKHHRKRSAIAVTGKVDVLLISQGVRVGLIGNFYNIECEAWINGIAE